MVPEARVFCRAPTSAVVTIVKKARARLESFVWTSLAVLFLAVPTVAQPPIEPDRNIAPERVAIVPFLNISGQPGDDWIGVGIAETLAVEFQHRSMFVIIAAEPVAAALRESQGADEAPGELPLLAEVGRDLGTRWVLSGGFQRSGEQLRITGRLVDVSNGSIVRASLVDGSVDDIFLLQDQLALELVDEADRNRVVFALPEESTPLPPGVATTAVPPGPATVAVSLSDELGGRTSREPAPARPGVAGFAAPAPSEIDGPPAPELPDVMRRDEAGRATVRAFRLTEALQLDGALDEAVYTRVPPIADFIQQVPVEGAPATEQTEAWILFDDTNVYVSARVHDSAPESEWVANEMRRDTNQLRQNDTFGVFFDTFYDRRNGFNFYTNPLGARADQQFTNEGNPNGDWNPVWDVRTGRFDGGWTVEMEIPFKTLRYRSGSPQLWGVQLRRAIRRKNEWTYITRIPISAGGGGGAGGIFRVSAAATLVGMEPPPSSRTFEVKPYVIGGTTTDVNAGTHNDYEGEVGLDVKYGITQNLTADLNYNADFAQVEVDEQQVNLTRFSLFFPEKREFFLEGRGIFEFARGGVAGGFGRRGGGFFGGGDSPTMFHSRRIGLEGSTIVPIYGGGRVTGKIGAFDVGALTMSTEGSMDAGTEPTNFTVVRVKRDILRRSSVGGIVTNRSVSLVGPGSSQAFGVDGTFAFYENVSLLGYYAKTQTPGHTQQDNSYQGKFDYAGDLYGFSTDHLVVEDNFIPEVGFLRRDNFERTNVVARLSPRVRSSPLVRQLTFEGAIDYFETADRGTLETRARIFDFRVEFENSDNFGVVVSNNFEYLDTPFDIGPDVTLGVGGYGFTNTAVSYTLGGQRRTSGGLEYTAGQFWNGNIKTLAFTRGRVNVLDQFSIEPNISVNWIDLPEGSFNTTLVSSRFNYAFTPRMFAGALVQYNSSSDVVSANVRLRWEYRPGSELFIVYTEERNMDTLTPNRYTELRNRGFVVKINRLFQM